MTSIISANLPNEWSNAVRHLFRCARICPKSAIRYCRAPVMLLSLNTAKADINQIAKQGFSVSVRMQ